MSRGAVAELVEFPAAAGGDRVVAEQGAAPVVAEPGPAGVRADVTRSGPPGGDGFAPGQEQGPLARLVPSGSRSSLGSRRAVPVPHHTSSLAPPLERIGALRFSRSRSSTLSARISEVRAAVSYSIRHSVFSRSGISRRVSSRSIAAFGTARAWPGCSLRRSQSAGTDGAGQRFLAWHQVSQEPIAARFRFQVASARPPHSWTAAAPTSSSDTSVSSLPGPSTAMVRSMAPA